MLTNIDVVSWGPQQVKDWLRGLCDDSSWMNEDYIINNNVDGRELLMVTADDLRHIGALKVDLQEHILEAIEKLRWSSSNFISKETLQVAILRLATQARGLQKQLVANRARAVSEQDILPVKVSSPTKDATRRDSNPRIQKQRVELDTLASVSAIVRTSRQVTEIISRKPFTKYDDYRSMKSLILALSIELTSTAQRDQFVEQPNDIIEKSSKALADYCERIVYGTKDILLIQPFQLKTVRLKKKENENDFGLTIRSLSNSTHIVEKMTPLSSATKTNELSVGDEVIYFNRFITGWSKNNVDQLLMKCSKLAEVILIVIKNPNE
uniref:Connector enhancer of kinase suppressor of ras 3 n=1 Tax=Aceria tosichella TaxID=561515 RepID=A0A6G1SP72_9ACAR